MIDWLSFVIPCSHPALIRGGVIQRINGDGELDWSTDTWFPIQGSFDDRIVIKTDRYSGDRTHLRVSGNLVKFFQGHNLFGSDDVPGLVCEFMRKLANDSLSMDPPLVTPSVEDARAWAAGDWQLTRVDVTDSFTLRSRNEVLAWLRAAEQTAHLAHRGRGQLMKGSTLYFGKSSRRWSLKLYSKGEEIDAHPDKQPALKPLPHAKAWADNVLRAELTLRGPELENIGYRNGSDWIQQEGVEFDPRTLLSERMGEMTMTTRPELDDEVLATLTAQQRLAYLAWRSGEDLRTILPARSFYRLRSKLLPHGVDVATVRPKEFSNVIPLIRVLEAKPAPVPSWAVGTPLYFEPRRIAR